MDKRHPKYMHAYARRRLGLTWVKPKWKSKKRQRIREQQHALETAPLQAAD